MGGGSYQTEASSGSVRGSAPMVASEHGCPSSGPSSGSGGADEFSWLCTGGGSYQTEASSGSVGGSAPTVASEHGCPSSGPSSGSGGADGGKIAAESGGGDTESAAGGCESTRARGVDTLVQIVPLGTADIGTADPAETDQKKSEWRRMFFHAEIRVMLRLVAPLWMNRFCLCYLDGERNRHWVVSL